MDESKGTTDRFIYDNAAVSASDWGDDEKTDKKLLFHVIWVSVGVIKIEHCRCAMFTTLYHEWNRKDIRFTP